MKRSDRRYRFLLVLAAACAGDDKSEGPSADAADLRQEAALYDTEPPLADRPREADEPPMDVVGPDGTEPAPDVPAASADRQPEPADAQAEPVGACALFVDRTPDDADRTLVWSHGVNRRPERCMRIVAGQSVRWIGNFAEHPLDDEGGDQPNPIRRHVDGLTTFPLPGIYGFVCGLHPGMRGAIHVVVP